MVYRVDENGRVIRKQEETYENAPIVENYSVDMGDKCSSWLCKALVALGALLVVVLLVWGVRKWLLPEKTAEQSVMSMKRPYDLNRPSLNRLGSNRSSLNRPNPLLNQSNDPPVIHPLHPLNPRTPPNKYPDFPLHPKYPGGKN